jgi:hypothetical protein
MSESQAVADRSLDKQRDDDQYSEPETVQRANAALKRMLSTPHKPHKEMKIGKAKAKPLKSSGKRKGPK